MRRESRRQNAEIPHGHAAETRNGHAAETSQRLHGPPAETPNTQDYGGRDVLRGGEPDEVGVGETGSSPGDVPVSQPPGRRPAAPQT